MKLINKDFAELSMEDFDETINGLSALSNIIAPIILKNQEGGIEAAAEFTLDVTIAVDALKEIKQQIYGVEEE